MNASSIKCCEWLNRPGRAGRLRTQCKGYGKRIRRQVNGHHYVICFQNKEMVPRSVLVVESASDPAKTELLEHNPFAMRSSGLHQPLQKLKGKFFAVLNDTSPAAQVVYSVIRVGFAKVWWRDM